MKYIFKQEGLIKSLSLLTLILIIIKAIGFFRSILMAHYFGATAETDVFFLASDAINNLVSIIIAGIPAIIIPAYILEKTKKRETGDRTVYRFMFVYFMAVGFIISIICIVFSPQIVEIIAMGQSQVIKTEVSKIFRIVACIIPFAILTNYQCQILNAEKRFNIAVMVTAIYSLTFIIVIVFGYQRFGINTLVISLIAADLLQFLIITPITLKYRGNIRVNFKRELSLWKNISLKMLPLMLATGTLEIQALIDRIVSGSLFTGGVTTLSYANTLFTLVSTIIIAAVATVYFTKMTESYLTEERQLWISIVYRGIKTILIIIIPIGLIVFFFSKDIVASVYFRGAFSLEIVNETASALSYYGIALIFIGIKSLLVKALNAADNIKTPVIVSILAVVINVILTPVLGRYFGISGVTGATAIAEGISAFVLITMFIKIYSIQGFYDILISSLRISISALVAILPTVHIASQLVSFAYIERFLVVTFVMFIIYFCVLFLIGGDKDIKEIIAS